MENIVNEQHVVYNLNQLSKVVKAFFSSKSSPLDCQVSFFKKMKKDRILIHLSTKANRCFISFDTLYTKAAYIKSTRKEVGPCVLDEIALFPIDRLTFLSDTLIKITDITATRLFSKEVISLIAPNILFPITNNFINVIGDAYNLRDLSISAQLTNLSMLPLFNLIIKAANPKLTSATLRIFTNEINASSFDTNLLKKACRPSDQALARLTNLKVEIVLNSLQASNIDIAILPFMLVGNFLPDNFTFIFSYLLKTTETSSFNVTTYTYSKRFFTLLQTFKRLFSAHLAYDRLSIFNRLFAASTNDQFTEVDKKLMLSVPESVDFAKFIYNLYTDYFSVVKRGIQYTEIYRLIREQTEKLTLIRTDLFDLNSFSKILKKISNNVYWENNGKLFSFGGPVQPVGQAFPVPLNCLISVDERFSEIKIATFEVQTILPLMFSAGCRWKEDFIIVGGLTENDLMPNVVSTPVYKINEDDLTAQRFIVSGGNWPGVLFRHKAVIFGDELIVDEGFTMNGYKGGLSGSQNAKLVKNEKSWVFLLREAKWKVNKEVGFKI